MAIFVPWLADAARLTGCPVSEVAGWRTRGHGGMSAVEGVVLHHTAGPPDGEMPSLRVIRDGRADLAGPLAHYGVGRSGTIYVVAAGCSWHAGASSWDGITSLNGRFIGVEAEDDGDGTWTPDQLDCIPRLLAACLYYIRRDSSRAAGHREVALPEGRKVDPTGIDMDAVRTRVADLLADPLRMIPRGAASGSPATRPLTPPTAPPPPLPTQLPTLQPGDRGPAVLALQTFLLRSYPSYARFTATGFFGDATKAAVEEFQRRSGLTPDGVVGRRTNQALRAAGFRG